MNRRTLLATVGASLVSGRVAADPDDANSERGLESNDGIEAHPA